MTDPLLDRITKGLDAVEKLLPTDQHAAADPHFAAASACIEDARRQATAGFDVAAQAVRREEEARQAARAALEAAGG